MMRNKKRMVASAGWAAAWRVRARALGHRHLPVSVALSGECTVAGSTRGRGQASGSTCPNNGGGRSHGLIAPLSLEPWIFLQEWNCQRSGSVLPSICSLR